jgi:hypothetical protein
VLSIEFEIWQKDRNTVNVTGKEELGQRDLVFECRAVGYPLYDMSRYNIHFIY